MPKTHCLDLRLVALVVFFSTLSGGYSWARQTKAKRFAWSTVEMGVPVHFVVYGDSADRVEAAIQDAVSQIQKCNKVFSDYADDSEISLLATRHHGEPLSVSDDLFHLLKRAQEIHQSTGGAFDASLGSLTRLWRQTRRDQQLPAAEELENARRHSGFENVELDVGQMTIQFSAGLRFDFGGIAKGFAADQALGCLREHGFAEAFVDLGGDIAVGAPPPGKTGWHIAIAPLDKTAAIKRFVAVSDCGVATSGDTEQFVEIDGVRYSHILDPKTGLGLRRRASVTVIAADATTADALASAYSVMSEADARQHARQSEATSYLLQELRGDKLIESATDNFPPIQKTK